MLRANPAQSRAVVEGCALVLAGDDIDTDRIIPARFATAPTFAGLGAGVFADDRAAAARQGAVHPFDDPRQAHATILFVNKNFGCGSSREHAVAALKGWRDGIRALAGESFAEIFFSNCVANGIPAVTISAAGIETLMRTAASQPQARFRLDLRTMTITQGDLTLSAAMPGDARERLIDGSWDTLASLLASVSRIRAVAQTVPYLSGFAGGTADQPSQYRPAAGEI